MSIRSKLINFFSREKSQSADKPQSTDPQALKQLVLVVCGSSILVIPLNSALLQRYDYIQLDSSIGNLLQIRMIVWKEGSSLNTPPSVGANQSDRQLGK